MDQGCRSQTGPIYLKSRSRMMTTRSNGRAHYTTLAVIAPLLASLYIAGCSTTPPPQVNLEQPGWKFTQGQAAWKPDAETPLINGHLLLARHENGDVFIQFTQEPRDILTLSSHADRWQIQQADRTRTGHGQPPEDFTWFQVPELIQDNRLSENLVKNWVVTSTDRWTWALDNPTSGESIRMVFYE